MVPVPSPRDWQIIRERAVKTKGVNCANTLAVVRNQLGAARYAALLATLPPATQALLGKTIVAFDMIPLADWIPFVEGVLDTVGRDEKRVVELVREWCDADFTGVYRFFVKLGSPTFVLSRAAQLWKTYYDGGTLEVTQLPRVDGLTHAEARLTAFVPWPAFGSLLQAFIEHIVFLTGGRQLTVRRTDAMRNGELTVSFDLTFLA
jgi:hypothetical protein